MQIAAEWVLTIHGVPGGDRQALTGCAGDIEKDFWYALDLLRSPKDHVEFTLVRDFVRDALAEVCSEVRVDTEKSVLKQGAVQHLYGRLSGQLQSEANDAQLLVTAPPLHLAPLAVGS